MLNYVKLSRGGYLHNPLLHHESPTSLPIIHTYFNNKNIKKDFSSFEVFQIITILSTDVRSKITY